MWQGRRYQPGCPVDQHGFEQSDHTTLNEHEAGKGTKKQEMTKHFLFLKWGGMIQKILNNRDIRDKYVLELRNRFETLQEKTEKSI